MQIGDIVEWRQPEIMGKGTIGIIKDIDAWSDPLVVIMIPHQQSWVKMGEEICCGRRNWKVIGRVNDLPK